MKTKSLKAMQYFETAPYSQTKKKLRSELPRRRRHQISPVLYSAAKLNARSDASAVNSNSCSYFGGGEVSCESSRVSVGSEGEAKSRLRKRRFDETEGGGAHRRVTKSNYGGKAEEKDGGGDGGAEVSESSCVESNSGANFGGIEQRKLKLKEIGGDEEGSEAVTKSEISESVAFEFKENDVTSFDYGEDFCSNVKLTVSDGGNRAPEFEFPVASSHYIGENFTVPNSESTIDQRLPIDSDLACKEQFSYDDDDGVSEYSSSQTISELQSDVFDENFSDCAPSTLFDSGSEFSERSDQDSTPSPTFALLLQYRKAFSRSINDSPRVNEIYRSTFLEFEDEEEEESYRLLRNRERKQVFSRDYTAEYNSTTDSGDLILHLRWQMVRWIVEESAEMELQPETKFIGVSLFDRFLSKGYLLSERTLEIVGIACLTLATRLEENQIINCVQRRNFYVGKNVYRRCEVVAMEWLVQEVLNFKCFLPTVYNFLWFYLRAAEADEKMEERAKYLAVLQMTDHMQLRYWPSTVAAALVILASLEGNHDASRQRVIDTHVRTEDDDLHKCIQSLEWLLKYV